MLSVPAMAKNPTDHSTNVNRASARPSPRKGSSPRATQTRSAQAKPAPSGQAGSSRPARAKPTRSTQAKPLMRFEPHDEREPAPDRLPSALKAFGGVPKMEPGAEVDPMAALTEDERNAHRKELADIVQAQRHAETLVGVSMRP
jgi:hypothetical protein